MNCADDNAKGPDPADDAVGRALDALIGRLWNLTVKTTGETRRRTRRVLAAFLALNKSYEGALRLFDASVPSELTSAWRRFHVDLMLRAPAVATKQDAKHRDACAVACEKAAEMRRGGRDGAEWADAFLAIEAKLARCVEFPRAGQGPEDKAAYFVTACAWKPHGAAGTTLVAAYGKDEFTSRLYRLEKAAGKLVPLRLQGFDDAEGVALLRAGELDGAQGEELYAICCKNRAGLDAHELSVWSIEGNPDAGPCTARERYRFPLPPGEPSGCRPYVRRDACAVAALPVGNPPVVTRGVLLGTSNAQRALTFLVPDGPLAPFRAHGLYSPGSDIDSLAVLAPREGAAWNRILVNYGLHGDLATVLLERDSSSVAFELVWQRPLGVMRLCAPLSLTADGVASLVVCGNGSGAAHPGVFGIRRPEGAARGLYAYRFSGEPELTCLIAVPDRMAWESISAAHGKVAGRDVCAALSTIPGVHQNALYEIDFFASRAGRSPLRFVLPFLPDPTRKILGICFADLNGDGSDELVTYGDEVCCHAPCPP